MAIADQIASAFNGSNIAYLADLYAQWIDDPNSVDPSFAQIFSVMDDAQTVILQDAKGASWAPRKPTDISLEVEEKADKKKNNTVTKEQLFAAANDSLRAAQLVNAYRMIGHRNALIDPLNLQEQRPCPELEPKTYGFDPQDMDRPIFFGKITESFLSGDTHTLKDVLNALKNIYCRSVAWEYMYLESAEQRQWLLNRIEKQTFSLNVNAKKQILKELAQAVGFEAFCQKRYVGVKRFGLDGGEVTIAALHALIRQSLQYDMRSIMIGMPHRGRLNVLTNIVGKPFVALFNEFAGGSYKPNDIFGTADVKYHLGYRNKVEIDGKEIELGLAFNPSHLEAVGAVVEGQIRAEQDHDHHKHMAVILHGDAAFAGQGVVYEILAMSQLPAYKTNGSIHIVVNNKIGFTTTSDYAYSGYYCTDVAKVARAPIIHVNGDDPEAVVNVMQLAVDFREKFATDVVIDIVCYRRNGHNETDEPNFTQPIMYQAVRNHENIHKIYADKLISEKIVSDQEVAHGWDSFQEHLQSHYVTAADYRPNDMVWIKQEWKNMKWRGQDRQDFETAVSVDRLKLIGKAIARHSEEFNCHPKLVRQLEAKAAMFDQEDNIDWATGEALAFGSLLLEGHPVRLSGQDCQRGTFSHRNAVLFDQKTQAPYVPLNHIQSEQAKLEVYNSFLSEFAVLGFEYGYSHTNSNALVLWEAQFGDFANGAQIIIDQFISAGESKWLQMSGLVMLLPHSQEGQGAEHSSARLERFLQLCAEDNLQVCNFTTPANYFHALRRQLRRNYRQPLVVMSPKSLLRHKLAQSPLSDFSGNSAFLPVIDEIDTVSAKDQIKRVVICSGKVYYDLLARRRELNITDIVIIRLEQLYPFSEEILGKILSSYVNAEIIWCQEEPENMGAWTFVDRRIEKLLHHIHHGTHVVQYVGRMATASPAPGLSSAYKAEQELLVDQALAQQKIK